MNLLLLIFALNCFSLARAEILFYNSFSNRLNKKLECVGDTHTLTFCRNAQNHSEIYDPKSHKPLIRPHTTDLGIFQDVEEQDEGDDDTSLISILKHQKYKKIRNLENKKKILELRNFVLLIRFPEHHQRFVYTENEYDILFNSNEADPKLTPTGSVKSYFERQSFNQFSIKTMISPWYNTTITEKQASGGCSSLCHDSRLTDAVHQALEYFDDKIDYREFDNDNNNHIDCFTIITTSIGAENGGFDDLDVSNRFRIWSHHWGLFRTFTSRSGVKFSRYNVNPALFGIHGQSITRIGVLVHELFHFMGLPDLYDTSLTSSGLNVYDVMASAWGVDGSQLYPGSLSPWCKKKLGWVNLKELKIGRNIIYPGNMDSSNEIYYLDYQNGEYIFIEYRKNVDYDALMPNGILIHHCDQRVTTSNRIEYYPEIKKVPHAAKQHYLCRLVQANGRFELEKEVWPKRFDQSVYWNTPDLVLDERGENNLISWKQLEKTDCKTSGNVLYGFNKLDEIDAFEFYYQNNNDVKNCFGIEDNEEEDEEEEELDEEEDDELDEEEEEEELEEEELEEEDELDDNNVTNGTTSTTNVCFSNRKRKFKYVLNKCRSIGLEICSLDELDRSICAFPRRKFWIKSEKSKYVDVQCNRSYYKFAYNYKRQKIICLPLRSRLYYQCC
jgi:M6 family metalloprotease-like protein